MRGARVPSIRLAADGRLEHAWPRAAAPARALQEALRSYVRPEGRPVGVRTVAAADLAYAPALGRLFAAVVVFEFPSLRRLETRALSRPIRFPYVPGLLSFREAPAILAAWKRLRRPADLLLCDGQGIAHPRGVGLASHLGLLTGVPTVGCAKSVLVGRHDEVGPRRGERSDLVFRGAIVGAALRTREGTRPIYVSPGHRVGLVAAVRYALACCRGFRIPEPIREADRLVGRLRRAATGAPDRRPTQAPIAISGTRP